MSDAIDAVSEAETRGKRAQRWAQARQMMEQAAAELRQPTEMDITPAAQQQPLVAQTQVQDTVQVVSKAHWMKRIKSVPQPRESTPPRSLRHNEPSKSSLDVATRANGGTTTELQKLDARLLDFMLMKRPTPDIAVEVELIVDDRKELVMKKQNGELVPTYERWSNTLLGSVQAKVRFTKSR